MTEAFKTLSGPSDPGSPLQVSACPESKILERPADRVGSFRTEGVLVEEASVSWLCLNHSRLWGLNPVTIT